uniref:Cytochrome b6-f complex subunit PetP n=1 Tax=Caloglossa monosticha TaxID=76906 RepID=A0A1Z1M5F6_9FLOR|nr:cytochrome b6-f complex subunit PetP [Caloglossa monosticha]ARW61071.1 cytochrome b6-f complex subunit PetP [Caloglossa monosticha]
MKYNTTQVHILSLPKKVKLKLLKYLIQSYELKIVGYKKIQIRYQVPIVELYNCIRIWTLFYEIDQT